MNEYLVTYEVTMPIMIAHSLPPIRGTDVVAAKTAKEAMDKAEAEVKKEQAELGEKAEDMLVMITDMKKI